MTFASALICLFEQLHISAGDRKAIQEKYAISSEQQLIEEQPRLAIAAKKERILNGPRLLAGINFLAHRRQEKDTASIDHLFAPSKNLKDSFEYFLAQKAVKVLRTQLETVRTATNGGKQSIMLNAKQKWLAKDEYQLDVALISESDSDGGANDITKVRHDLGLTAEDSPWYLDQQEWKVVLAKYPDTIRVPVPLFQKLFPYQRVGLEWLTGLAMDDSGGILGDEMGMGKTLTSLTFILCLMHSGKIRNALIVCPVPIVNATWWKETEDLLSFFGGQDSDIQVRRIVSGMPERQRTKILKEAKTCTTDKPHLVITPYSQFTCSTHKLAVGFKKYNKTFDYVILDEGHKVKNQNSNTSVNLRKVINKRMNQTRVLILTGTPLINKLEELYNLFTLATPGDQLGKWKNFREQYVKPIEAARQRTASDYVIKKGTEIKDKLNEVIKPYVLQRKRKDYLKNVVPANHKFDVWTKLSTKQRQLYQAYLQSDDSNVQGIKKGDHKCVLPVIGKLRMICGHPLMEFRGHVLDQCHAHGADKVIAMSPKLKVLVDMVEKWAEKGHRSLIFCHFIEGMDILEYTFSQRDGIHTCRIDGSTSASKLALLVKDFNSNDSLFNVMILSIKTGGEGLTLTGASRCFVFDPVWSQAEADQIVARISRPGQFKECESYFLISAGTVEEKMLGKQIWKGCLDRTVLGQTPRGSTGSCSNDLSRLYNKNELSRLFELAPDGSCETIERLKESGNFDERKWKHKCSISKSHEAVVGISRRCDLYDNTTSSKKGKASDCPEDAGASVDAHTNKKFKSPSDPGDNASFEVANESSPPTSVDTSMVDAVEEGGNADTAPVKSA